MRSSSQAPRRGLPLAQIFFCWIGAFIVGLAVHATYAQTRKSRAASDPFVALLDDAGQDAASEPPESLRGSSVDDGLQMLQAGEPSSRRIDALVSAGATWKLCAHEKEICPCRSGIVRFGFLSETPGWVVNEKEETQYPSCEPMFFPSPELSLQNAGKPQIDVPRICECLTPAGQRPIVKAILPAIRTTTTPSPCGDGQPVDFCGNCRTPKRSRQDLCAPNLPNISHLDMGCRMLWSCDKSISRRAGLSASAEVLQAQEMHDLATEEICKLSAINDQLDVYLDCGFYDQWAKYTKDGSEWIQEAYITYVGGSSKYAGQITNLVNSVHMFSTKPIVVVVIGHEFICPPEWKGLKQLMVYRMTPLLDGISFNFNKVRGMIAARVVVGVELDSDQIIVSGMDKVFEGTRRESTADYPFPILPVHFASLDANPGEPYASYKYKNYNKPHGMRWCHAHPSWTYWALPFFSNMLLINLMAWNTQRNHMTDWSWVRPFNLDNKAKTGINMLEQALGPNPLELRQPKRAIWEKWMNRDETSMNVYLWKAGAEKAWCKFDLEPCLYFRGKIGLPEKLYNDNKWYPDGLPIVFWSMHNTKAVFGTAKVLKLIEYCMSPEVRAWTNCTNTPQTWRTCTASRFVCDYFSIQKETEGQSKWDFKPLAEQTAKICCCMRPRPETPFFWQGKWYAEGSQVPMNSAFGRKEK
eukprot:CAMPEP_0178393228 /NCGR_PEP_ID=MMETSP0689_2-20121128/12079_1 /TAXON_ID=160604 /ORGANISM="Amphidinium massartii, Strain CS-259" /LENGTH=695 /DNA_ID=CAMNT_0020013813 /DNA_START=80 /DNA_END=2164 /DNA_ORIENTATION=-